MRSASSIRHPFQGDRIWKASDGSWLVIDEVVGKHEMITYAVALTPMENHGGRVSDHWLDGQFILAQHS